MRQIRFALLALFLPVLALAQFTVNNAATQLSASSSETCFRLTPADYYQRGAVWATDPVNLAQSFELRARLYFGTSDAGADGIAFVLQREGTGYIGNVGAGIGYHRFNGETPLMPVDVPGPVPSFIVEFDTWQNFGIYGQDIGDPAGDHIGFMSNSNAYHTSPTTLQPPHEFSANIEDGQWHDVRFSWNAVSRTMTVQFTTTNSPLVTQTFSYSGDIVNTIFGGSPLVYWGFTASTGSFNPAEHKVCIQTPPGDCGQLRTQTPGGWGAPPRGNNPASYMYSHFAAAFPSGLTVGTTPNFNVRLTSPQAVTNFLPCAGTARKLTQNLVNPAGSSLKNTLAGHLVALTLSVQFDENDPGFGAAGIHLGSMLIGSGPFANWTVSDFLAEANKVLGGGTSLYTVQQALETASAINENYVDGTRNNQYLNCPNAGPGGSPRFSVARPGTAEAPVANLGLSPNPSRGSFELSLGATEGPVRILVTGVNGTVVEQRSLASARNQRLRFDLSRQPAGLYLVRVIGATGEQTVKVIVQK